jgi:hypothetical protein
VEMHKSVATKQRRADSDDRPLYAESPSLRAAVCIAIPSNAECKRGASSRALTGRPLKWNELSLARP